MNVQHVKLFVLGNVHHLAGQGRLVRRKLKQRIGGNVNLVIKEVFVEEIEPNRLIISNEVDAVPALGQGFAQLGGHHAGAAKGRVTYNADVHGVANAKRATTFRPTANYGRS